MHPETTAASFFLGTSGRQKVLAVFRTEYCPGDAKKNCGNEYND
jgi:hypothetical protein